ncbi:MAG: HTTM domain-containing protein [Planctomycetota bacterium]
MRSAVSSASLGAFRICFGGILFIAALRYFAKGWIPLQFVEPEFFFSYPGFSWVCPLPGPLVYLPHVVWAGAALCLALGVFARWSSAVLFVAVTWAHLCDKTNYLNHYYLISLISFLMIWMPTDAAFALHARWNPKIAKTWIPAWPVNLLRFQAGCVYFFAGVAKLQSDWLVDAQPLRLWLTHSSDIPWIGGVLGQPVVAWIFSWAGAAFDLSAPFLLLWPRTRLATFAVAVVFHVLTAVLFPIGLFPWIMILVAFLFLSEDWPLRFLRRPLPEVEHIAPSPVVWSRLAIGAFVLVQLALPLRHWSYPGDVLWNERGFRFSWMVMLVEKKGYVTFRVVDAAGHEIEVKPGDFLTSYQVHMMSTQPDMILDFARHLKRRFEASGSEEPRVFADAWVALHAKPSARLIDPNVDLGASDGPTAGWITERPTRKR